MSHPNTYFIIFQKKHQRNLAQILFSELGRFRPGPFSRTAFPPGLQARKLGPGPGKWRSHAGLLGPWGDRLPRARAEQKPPAARPPKTHAHFSPSPLSLLSAAATGELGSGAVVRAQPGEKEPAALPSPARRIRARPSRARGSVERCSTVP